LPLRWTALSGRKTDRSEDADHLARGFIEGCHRAAMRVPGSPFFPWRRPPWRYLILYLDWVTAPIVSVVLALAVVGLRSLFVHG
jgi:hypothetical protein